MDEDALSALRAAVDDADHAILEQLARRRTAVDALARHKRRASLPPTDAAREDQLRARWRAQAHAHGLPAEVALDILETILASSRVRVAEVVSGAEATSGGQSAAKAGPESV